MLVSVNPYQFFPIYGTEIIHDYVGRTRVEVPPHIYGIAEQAYRNMIMEKENQCILIRYGCPLPSLPHTRRRVGTMVAFHLHAIVSVV